MPKNETDWSIAGPVCAAALNYCWSLLIVKDQKRIITKNEKVALTLIDNALQTVKGDHAKNEQQRNVTGRFV